MMDITKRAGCESMYVIMDMEWFRVGEHRICPTQIAALRVDAHWRTLSMFFERMRPQDGVTPPWGHVAFTGASQAEFQAAASASTVLGRLERWLRPDDVLCWWLDDPPKKFALLVEVLLKRCFIHRRRILRPYFLAFADDGKAVRGEPYDLARDRGISIPGAAHCAMNDVVVVQRLMRAMNIPTSALEAPAHKREAPRTQRAFPLWYDQKTGLVHAADSPCLARLHGLQGVTVKTCLDHGFQPCPTCAAQAWKRALREYNAENIRLRRCGYFYFPDSPVFHRGDCPALLSTRRTFNGAVYYDTCVNTCRRPCKRCKPVPGLFAFAAPRTEKESVAPWLDKKAKRALARHRQAVQERESARQTEMTDTQRRDMATLTATDCAFWASRGYKTFHLRTCRKLNGLTHLRGFSTCQQALNAGYQPCRECKPTPKYDIQISMSLETREREDETPENLLALCARLGLNCEYEEPLLRVHTAVADWKLNLTMRPVIIEHKPQGSADYHRQHRMFLSVTDAIHYIHTHDSAKKRRPKLPEIPKRGK